MMRDKGDMFLSAENAIPPRPDYKTGPLQPILIIKSDSNPSLCWRNEFRKQAVQQLILDLEKSDILRREPDPNDGRGKIVHYTEKGFAAQQDIQNAKRKVEEDIKRHLGEQDFEHLMTTLRKLGSDP